MHHGVIEFAALFLAGLLAGEEFVVRYGVRGPLAALDDRAHIEFRQGLIRTLRVLVPAIFGPALAAGVAAAIAAGAGPGVALRWAGVLALLGWALVTLFGTVPINSGALDWRPAAPPGLRRRPRPVAMLPPLPPWTIWVNEPTAYMVPPHCTSWRICSTG